MPSTIGVVIPTYQAAKHLPFCLPPLLNSPIKPRILIIDSSSTDDTMSIARSMGAETHLIAKREFNHGTTRELGRRLIQTDIVVMMTQDAYAASPDMLGKLVLPLLCKHKDISVPSISYARQLPHKGASAFASFSRRFNYPDRSHVRSIADKDIWGAYTFFCSNSCAAYHSRSLDEIGGFAPVLFGEDAIAAAQLLHLGHRIAYVAEAEVFHSHDYTLKQEFYRHFDIGLSRRMHQELISSFGSDSTRGKLYVKTLLKELWKAGPSMIPYALLQTFVKWCGYKIGRASLNASSKWNKCLSSQKQYWENSN